MTVTGATVSAAEGFREAIASLRQDGAEAVVISEDAFTFSNRALIVELTAENRMVEISAFREFVMAGGVMSYGANAAERLRRQAQYAARWCGPTFRAAHRPADALRVCGEPQAARALGVTIPQVVLLRANKCR